MFYAVEITISFDINTISSKKNYFKIQKSVIGVRYFNFMYISNNDLYILQIET